MKKQLNMIIGLMYVLAAIFSMAMTPISNDWDEETTSRYSWEFFLVTGVDRSDLFLDKKDGNGPEYLGHTHPANLMLMYGIERVFSIGRENYSLEVTDYNENDKTYRFLIESGPFIYRGKSQDYRPADPTPTPAPTNTPTITYDYFIKWNWLLNESTGEHWITYDGHSDQGYGRDHHFDLIKVPEGGGYVLFQTYPNGEVKVGDGFTIIYYDQNKNITQLSFSLTIGETSKTMLEPTKAPTATQKVATPTPGATATRAPANTPTITPTPDYSGWEVKKTPQQNVQFYLHGKFIMVLPCGGGQFVHEDNSGQEWLLRVSGTYQDRQWSITPLPSGFSGYTEELD